MPKSYAFLLLFMATTVLVACVQSATQKNNKHLTSRELSKIYCASCHQYPEPSQLPRATWEGHVLPRMGYMMGIYPADSVRQSLIEAGSAGELVRNAEIFPEEPLLNEAQWAAIQQFYLKNAPDSLQMPVASSSASLDLFQPRFPDYQLSPPSTTLLQFHENGIYLGDAHSKGFYNFDTQLNMQQAAKVREGAVSMQETPSGIKLTVMGSFSPTDAPTGFLLNLPTSGGQPPSVLIQPLQRPVHAAYADLNADGREDIVICEFAKWTGGLSWWEQDEKGQYQKHQLRDQPGAIKTQIQDFTEDGRPDILALFGQGDEGFFLYINEGEGQFREKRVLHLYSSMGSSSFNLFDYNDDGRPDILYTAGDNADYPPILKPYHGIYIYENKGNFNFEQAFFHPMPGAYGAHAHDLDLDGDLDIAAISFFPDFANDPTGGFIFLENEGGLKMKPYTFPQSTLGRWIVMDAGDLDNDGDIDLALGSLAFEVIPDNGEVEGWVQNGLPFLVLENLAVDSSR